MHIITREYYILAFHIVLKYVDEKYLKHYVIYLF